MANHEEYSLQAAVLLEEIAKAANIGDVLAQAIDRTRKSDTQLAFETDNDNNERVTVKYFVPVEAVLAGTSTTVDEVLTLLATAAGANRSVTHEPRSDGDWFVLSQHYFSRDLHKVMESLGGFLASQQAGESISDQDFNKRVMTFMRKIFTKENAATDFINKAEAATSTDGSSI